MSRHSRDKATVITTSAAVRWFNFLDVCCNLAEVDLLRFIWTKRSILFSFSLREFRRRVHFLHRPLPEKIRHNDDRQYVVFLIPFLAFSTFKRFVSVTAGQLFRLSKAHTIFCSPSTE